MEDTKSNNNNQTPAPSEKINKTEVSKIKKKITWKQIFVICSLACGNFIGGAVTSLQGPFFPKEAEDKGASPTAYGLIQGIINITIVIGAPIFGKILSSFGHAKFFLILGMTIMGTSTMGFGLLTYAQDTVTFVALAIVLRLSEGIVSSIFRPCVFSIGALQNTDRSATIFSIIRTFAGLGLMIGPLIGGALFDAGGFKLPFLVIGSFFLFNSVGIFFLLPPHDSKDKGKAGPSGALKFWIDIGTISYFVIALFNISVYGYMSVTLEPHLRQFELSGFYLGLLFSVQGILFGVTAFLAGWLIDKFNNANFFLALATILEILSLILIGPMPFLHITTNLWTVVVALMFFGSGCSMTAISVYSALLEHSVSRGFSKNLETYGFVSSLYLSSSSLGLLLGPSAGGYLYEKLGFDDSTLVVACVEILVLVFIGILIILKRILLRKKKEKINQEHLNLPNGVDICTHM